MRIGIIGAGNIASMMAATLQEMNQVESYAVAARDLKRAEEFAKEYNVQKAYGSYEELVNDKEVELVYVATPHSHHYQHVKLCLEHGKHVLCEKAFTRNAKEAKEIIKIAREKNLLLTEAVWVRYMPFQKTLKEVMESGTIGKISSCYASLGYTLGHIERMQKLELAGGALLDLGVYAINFAFAAFGNEIERISSNAVLTDKGVDAQNQIIFTYKDGKTASLHSNMLATTDRRGIIYGEKGFIEVDNINNFEEIRVYDSNYQMIEKYERPKQITGYEYEVEACIEAIRDGKIECPQMSHKETIQIMEIMDQCRNQWGITFPGEE